MSNPIENLSIIDKLKPMDLNCNIFSVYDFESGSIQELLCKFFEKINECIAVSNATFKLAEWLVTIGLKQEVAITLEKWLADGTLANIINETIFKELNDKVNTNKDNIEKLDLKVDQEIGKLKKFLEYNVLDYGVDNTGVEDITLKLNKLIELVSVDGGTIYFPRGKYKVNSQIIMKPYVILKGCTMWRGKDKEGYSTFECYSLDKPQFLLCEYSSLVNFRFTYPNQGETVESIKEYDWLISTDSTRLCDDIQLSDLYMENPYKGINIVNGGRWNIQNIYGQPIKIGLRIDESLDMGQVSRVEFWTFKYYVGTPIYEWIKNNGTAFELCKFDGGLFSNLFAYGYNRCYHFNGGAWGTFVGCTADICNFPILVDNCNMVEIIGGSFIGASYNSTICKINNIGQNFKLLGCNFFGNNSIGVLNMSQSGNLVIDVNFKEKENKIKFPIINNGVNPIVRSENPTELYIGTVIDNGIQNIVWGGEIVKRFSYDDFSGLSANSYRIENGFGVNMGNIQNGESINDGFACFNDLSIPKGLYYLEFVVKMKTSTDRKRLNLDYRKDTGEIYNSLINDFPFLPNDFPIPFRIPIYIPDVVYKSGLKFHISFYDEPAPTGDYIEFHNITLVKYGKRTTNSNIDYCYKYYKGDNAIDYSVNI